MPRPEIEAGDAWSDMAVTAATHMPQLAPPSSRNKIAKLRDRSTTVPAASRTALLAFPLPSQLVTRQGNARKQ